METTLYSVSYKNQPKVYGIDDDYTDTHPQLSDLLEKISGIDGRDLVAFKAKIVEISQRAHGNNMGRNGCVSSVCGMLAQAWTELK